MNVGDQLAHCPTQTIACPHGAVSFRRNGSGSGSGAPLVLLHGIGSSSASWVAQLHGLANAHNVLAWDAPGYGESDLFSIPAAQIFAKPTTSPSSDAAMPADDPTANAAMQISAAVYGAQLWAWLDALNVTQPIALVGQSLGCIMAAAALVQRPAQVARLTLISPALGYGKSAPQVRDAKRDERLQNVAALGMAGIAEKRAAAMLAPGADTQKIDYVRATMASVPIAGYLAATQLLASADLKSLLDGATVPITVAAGRSDTITPYAQCKAFAQEINSLFVTLNNSGHLASIDVPDLVNALIRNSAQ